MTTVLTVLFIALTLVVIERMVWAWILTIPVSGAAAYFPVRLIQAAGWRL